MPRPSAAGERPGGVGPVNPLEAAGQQPLAGAPTGWRPNRATYTRHMVAFSRTLLWQLRCVR